jgi:hypothetical protein
MIPERTCNPAGNIFLNLINSFWTVISLENEDISGKMRAYGSPI